MPSLVWGTGNNPIGPSCAGSGGATPKEPRHWGEVARTLRTLGGTLSKEPCWIKVLDRDTSGLEGTQKEYNMGYL